MRAVDLYTSEKYSILALRHGDTCWARDYIDSLQDSDAKKLLSLLERTAAHGPPANVEKFKKLQGKIYEFKSFQDRLLCFFDGQGVLVVTHGFKKKRDRVPKSEIERAETLRATYLETKK